MIAWSERDSNSGSITFSRHWSDRLDAVHEPSVSNCVAAGRRYTPRSAFSCAPSTGIADMAAVADGYGSITIIMSSIFIALTMSRPRVCEFGACPQ